MKQQSHNRLALLESKTYDQSIRFGLMSLPLPNDCRQTILFLSTLISEMLLDL